jgi:hypothetical protein
MFLAFSSVSPASHHFIIAPSPSITGRVVRNISDQAAHYHFLGL